MLARALTRLIDCLEGLDDKPLGHALGGLALVALLVLSLHIPEVFQ